MDKRENIHRLCEKGDLKTIKSLIDSGIDVNIRDNDENTPLHSAALSGNCELVKILLDSGANVNAKNKDSYTPLYKAVEEGYIDIVKMLIVYGADIQKIFLTACKSIVLKYYGGDIYHSDKLNDAIKKWFNIVDVLIATGVIGIETSAEVNKMFGRALIRAGVINGKKLHVAASEGHLDIVKILIKAGADVNAKNINGSTPLHDVAASGGHLDIANELIKAGADVNLKDNLPGFTPLHVAASEGHLGIVKILIKAGANVNVKDNLTGFTPLHIAVSFFRHLDIANELIKAGADVNAKDINGYTPLHVAASGGHLDIANELIKAGAGVNAKDINGYTPLHVAASGGHLDIANELIKAGADVNVKDINGNTPEDTFTQEVEVLEEKLLDLGDMLEDISFDKEAYDAFQREIITRSQTEALSLDDQRAILESDEVEAKRALALNPNIDPEIKKELEAQI